MGSRWRFPRRVDDGLIVGVDMNVGQVATSTGHIMRMPNKKAIDAKIERLQRRKDHCKKGSNSEEGLEVQIRQGVPEEAEHTAQLGASSVQGHRRHGGNRCRRGPEDSEHDKIR